jgi:cell division protein FtsQ
MQGRRPEAFAVQGASADPGNPSGRFAAISSTDLASRRKQLRRQRRQRKLQGLVRLAGLIGLSLGAIRIATLPEWVIRQAEQVQITGNRTIPTPKVQGLLPIQYPQSLMRLAPGQLAQDLKTLAPFSDVVVHRQMFPPRLTVQVQELEPIALVNFGSTSGLLDAKGRWIELKQYQELAGNAPLPNLKVIGDPQNYRLQWSQLYHLIKASPLKITLVDWQNLNNLILQTELGTVHLGPYSDRFPEQLLALDRLRHLPGQLHARPLDFIDLRDPERPLVQVKPAAALSPDANPETTPEGTMVEP